MSLRDLLRAAVPDLYAFAEGVPDASPYGEQAQIVSVYGYPGTCSMNEFGCDEDPARRTT